MFQVLNVCRHFYNMCLEDRKLTWEFEQRTVTKSEQERLAIRYRKTFPQAAVVFSQTLQTVVDDLDKAFQAFFRRVKAGETPGYPRFKGYQRFHSFAFKQFGVGAKLDGRRLELFGIGRVAVRWHRPIAGFEPAQMKTCRIVHKAGRWYACFVCEIADKSELPKTGRKIALDLGVKVMAATSEGEVIENPHFYRDGQIRLRILQRSLQRKTKGGKNRKKALLKVQRQHEHVASQRRDYAHKLTTGLVKDYDLIALEALKIKNMVRNQHLSKSILDAGWGLFKALLTNKAADAGRELVLVNPAYTSKACSHCGELFDDFDLGTRWVACGCGLSLDRDVNAAINILLRAFGRMPFDVPDRRDATVGQNVEVVDSCVS